VYGQLILEQASISGIDSDILNQMFDFMVRDFAQFAMQIYSNHSSKDAQRDYCVKIMLIKAVPNSEQYNRVWEQYVSVLNGEYAMNE
jgi:acyl-CoA dehydrogenase